jgi:hypothetical protein
MPTTIEQVKHCHRPLENHEKKNEWPEFTDTPAQVRFECRRVQMHRPLGNVAISIMF